MKKIFSCLLAVVLMAICLTACGKQITPDGDPSSNKKDEKISIVVTTFPQYDWVRAVLGDNAENVDLTLLLDNGVDLHNYSPTVEHIAKIADCDLFIYVGGESDGWVADALRTVNNQDIAVVNLMEVLGDRVKEEELVEGMELDHDHEDEEEMDEHVWLSLKNAQVICSDLAKELGNIDTENAAVYSTNAVAYNAQLAELDGQYQAVADASTNKVLLFGDRFPFRYLVDDYGLAYFGAFAGCSAETEASFETVAFLAGKVNELNLNHIMVIERSDQSMAKTIIETTTEKNQDVLVLDSMQSVTAKEIATGTTYLSIMESNLEVLKTALS